MKHPTAALVGPPVTARVSLSKQLIVDVRRVCYG